MTDTYVRGTGTQAKSRAAKKRPVSIASRKSMGSAPENAAELGAEQKNSTRVHPEADYRNRREHPCGITRPRTVKLPAATAARLTEAEHKTGLPSAVVIDTALELLLSGHPTPADTPTRPAAWRHALGWHPAGPPPTVDDLLPPDLQQRLLDVWLATGTNVAYNEAMAVIALIDEGGLPALKLVTESMEADLHDRLEVLRAKWEGGQAA